LGRGKRTEPGGKMKKKWRCKDCQYEFETSWIPYFMVRCPRCGSKNVYRIDKLKGKGFGPRFKRGVCE